MVVPNQGASRRSELERRLEHLDSPAVADAQRGLNVLHPRIKSLAPGRTIAGPAFTVRAYPGSMMSLQKAMLEACSGDVLVVDAEADLTAGALWGDIMAEEAKRRGFKAVVIDGAVRDLRGLLDVGFPTFAAGLTPRLGTNLQVGQVQVPISCGGVAVRPGDWVFGDDDGLVVLPIEQLETIVEAAEAIERRDREMARRVADGESLADMLGFHRFIYGAQESVSVLTRPDEASAPAAERVGNRADG